MEQVRRRYRYNIFRLSMQKMLRHGTIDLSENALCISEQDLIFCYQDPEEPTEVKPDSILFYQTRLVLNRYKGTPIYGNSKRPIDDFNDLFVTVDFTDSKSSFERIAKFKYIKLKLTPNSEMAKYEIFMKSNSMSKNCKVLYINADKRFEDDDGKRKPFRDILTKRVKLDLLDEKKQITISKWFAYTGLALSDVKFIDELLIDEKNSVVVDDFERVHYISCITAVSLRSLAADVESHKDSEGWKKTTTFDKLKSIVKSKDWRNLKNAGSERPGAKEVYDAIEALSKLIEKADKENRKELTVEEIDGWNAQESIAQLNNPKAKNSGVEWFEIECGEDFPLPHTINAFDGEGLMSEEMADVINKKLKEYGIETEDHYSMQIRLLMCKGVLHACKLQEFFKEHGVTKIEVIKRFIGEKGSIEFEWRDTKDIHFIFTKSQVKLEKFAANLPKSEDNSLSDWQIFIGLLKKYNHVFGVSSFGPAIHKPARMNLEFFATLPFNESVYNHILEDSKKELDNSLEEERLMKRFEDVDQEIYKTNPSFFRSTSRYSDIRLSQYSTFIKDSLELDLPVRLSRRLFLSSDLMMFLNWASGLPDPSGRMKSNGKPHRRKEGELEKSECYIPNSDTFWVQSKEDPTKQVKVPVFKAGNKVTILRSPHYSRNEIALLKCAEETEDRKKYFGKLRGVIWLNPYSVVAERLSGADMDGDEVVVISDSKIVNRVDDQLMISYTDRETNKKREKLSHPPVIIPSSIKDIKDYPTDENIIDCLKKTFNTDVGLISNEALRVAEYSYSPKPNDTKEGKIARSNFVAFYTILGGLSIDAAKKGFRPKFVPASSFVRKDDGITKISSKEIRETFTSSLYIEFKDTVKKIRYFDSVALGFTSKDKNKMNRALLQEYDKLMGTPKTGDFWAKYLIQRIKGWGYEKLNEKPITIEADRDNEVNSNAFLKAVCVRKIVNSYIYAVNTEEDKKLLELNFIKSTMRDSCPPGDNDEIRTNIMIDAIQDCEQSGVDLLHRYCEANYPFHYLQKDDQKERFFKQTLKIESDDLGMTSEAKKLFKDFKNGGYKNLYLAIMYKKISEEMSVESNVFPSTIEDLMEEPFWSFLHKKGILSDKGFLAHFNETRDNINDEAEEFIGVYMKGYYKKRPTKAFKDRMNKELKEKFFEGRYPTMGQIQYVMKAKDEQAVIDLCKLSLLKYLKGQN